MNQGLEIYGGYNSDLVRKELSASDGQGDSRSMILDNIIFLQNGNIQI